MKITIHTFEQRSEAWEKIRVGKTGGSEVIGLTTPARQKTLIWKKLAEQLTGEQEEVFVTEAMQHGISNEPIVIALYEAEAFSEVGQVGYVTNSDYPLLGLSPDGLVGDLGAIEIKCPMPKKHVEVVATNKVPTEHKPQLAQYFLILPKLEWIDFVSYNEKVTAKPMHIIRLTRAEMEEDIAKLKAGYVKFEAKTNEYLKLF